MTETERITTDARSFVVWKPWSVKARFVQLVPFSSAKGMVLFVTEKLRKKIAHLAHVSLGRSAQLRVSSVIVEMMS